jgi:hypothetical protein
MRSPGLFSKHYSPRAPLTLYEGAPAAVEARIKADASAATAAGHRVGVLDFGADPDPTMVASRLFAAIRELDASGVDLILARGIPALDGLGLAVQDRLRRAAAGRVVKVESARTPFGSGTTHHRDLPRQRAKTARWAPGSDPTASGHADCDSAKHAEDDDGSRDAAA